MLRFLYYSETGIDILSACELVPFAKDFKLVKLCLTLEKIVGGQGVSVPSCLPVLHVAYNPLMVENTPLQQKLKQEGLDFAVTNMDKIDFKPLEFMNPQISSHILQRLQQTIGNKWSSLSGSQGWVPGADAEPEEEAAPEKKKKKDKKEAKDAKDASPSSAKKAKKEESTVNNETGTKKKKDEPEEGKKKKKDGQES